MKLCKPSCIITRSLFGNENDALESWRFTVSHYRLLHGATILQTPEVPFTLFSRLHRPISIIYKYQASFLISLLICCYLRRMVTIFWVPNRKRSKSKLYIVTCLFNFYAEYIMRNTGLEEAQAGIKIARRNITWLSCTDHVDIMHWSRGWSCTDTVTEHGLITWLSCSDHVT